MRGGYILLSFRITNQRLLLFAVPENKEETAKRLEIEAALEHNRKSADLELWKRFALSDYGLVNDDLRRKIWPLLVSVDPDDVEPVPSIDDLKTHVEYNQVILDVNRSLKRFPPGIPYEQRIALQDQLTVLIMRVITKYPHLRYYQGYHDVAITFLLVVGEDVAFHVMEVLSTNHLVECMQETMEPTNRRLKYLYPLIQFENAALCNYLEKSYVGTLFALPWFLTWFGHSLNQYRDVVRLYDYFLAVPHLMPIYVTAAIVLYREADIFQVECDMGALHCLLSQLPDDLPFEYLLVKANELYAKYPPETLEEAVDVMLAKEQEQRRVEEEQRKKRQAEIQRRRQLAAKRVNQVNFLQKMFPHAMMYRRSIFVTTVSIVVGICAYYYRHQLPALR